MLNFKDNFFFAKFSILFFLIVLFGYWGIDLNSEELFIAFSFLLLVVLGFILLRVSVLNMFLRTLNQKYSRQLLNFFYLIGHLDLQNSVVANLLLVYRVLLKVTFLLFAFSLKLDSISTLVTKLNQLNLIYLRWSFFAGLIFFISERSTFRRFYGFRNQLLYTFKFEF